jgi:hypothetical protein
MTRDAPVELTYDRVARRTGANYTVGRGRLSLAAAHSNDYQ